MTRFPHGILHHMLTLVGISVLIMLFGCAGQRPVTSAASYNSPETALRALAASSAGDQAITATTRITIDRNGDRYPLKIATMIQRPASLRVESLPLMGPPDFLLSIVDEELRVFFPGKKAFYIGRATPRNLSRFLPVSLPAAEVIPLLMGASPDSPEEIQSMRGELTEGLYRIDQYGSHAKIRTLWIDPAREQLIRFQRFSTSGTILFSADFAEYVRIGKRFLPKKITIRKEETGTLTIRHTDFRQVPANSESFPLQIPEGLLPILLDP